jgi:hypothetical protein
MTDGAAHVLENTPAGRTLVVTGRWSREAAEVLERGDADGLVLNYARGFCEGDLEFLDMRLGVRRLNVLDRGIADLGPIARLGEALEELSVQASERAELDLGTLPHLRSLAGEWGLIGDTLSRLDELQIVITWRFNEIDLHAFRDHLALQHLTIKEAPYLESLSGVGDLPEVSSVGVLLARRLRDISDVAGLASSLRELELQDCPALSALDDVEPLVNLRFFGCSNCGDVESLAPVGALTQLEVLYAWGSTHVIDRDLSPLARLPQLREIRMRDRRGYKPTVADLAAALSA